MKLFTHWIVRKVISNNQEIDNVGVRARYGTLEAVVSIVINLILFVVKLVLGLMVNSVSVIADAVHTLSDSGTSIIILIGFRIAKKPGDREHPFGHGRAEPIAALIVAIILIVAGIELLKSSAVCIMHPQIEAAQISWFLAVILAVTVVIKELMARFAQELGRMIQSKTLEADFWHHRSDAFSTLLVLVAIACARLNFMYVDGVAGAGVALIVMYSGYAVARSVISPLLGERPSRETISRIEDTASSLEGVLGVHDVIVHRYGQANLISLHIEVDDSRPVIELHDLSEQVEELIENKLGGSAVVHIDPLNKNHERYQEISTVVEQAIRQDSRITGFHELRIVGRDPRIKVVFDITIDEKVSRKETRMIIQQLTDNITRQLPDVRLAIKAEPPYAYTV